MRIVILLSPEPCVEHCQGGKGYAKASFGFDAPLASVEDRVELAKGLRGVADMLEAPAVCINDTNL